MNGFAKDGPRIVTSALAMLLFGAAFALNPHAQLLIGAIIAMATQAVQYWLGSSKGSSDKSDQLAAAAIDNARP